jgi:hypothetical protein
MKIFSGKNEIELKTETEVLLAAALKAVLFAKGDKPTINDAHVEIYLNRFSLTDALGHQVGTVQIATDGNNGRDFVRLVK